MKNILCYGDSNTWGQVPFRDFVKQRYPFDTRWTGVLQNLAGPDYRILEEGLNGRTTGLEDPAREGRNGAAYLPACLDSHVPLDLVVFMLGTNDLKKKFNSVPEIICGRMQKLVQITKERCAEPPPCKTQILVMAPVIPRFQYLYEDLRHPEIESFARRQVGLYETMCQDEKVHFFDASAHLEASSLDGAHLEARVHQEFGKAVFGRIRQILV